jgi:hypothetical protein
MRLTLLTVAILLTGAATGAGAAEKGAPLDDAQCKAAWTIVSPNGAAISQGETVPSIIDFTMVEPTRMQLSTPTSSRRVAPRAGSRRQARRSGTAGFVPPRLVLRRGAKRLRG